MLLNTIERPNRRGALAKIWGVAIVVLAVLPSSGTAQPPAGRTYYLVSHGLAEPFSVTTSCVEFTDTLLCTEEGDCGPWEPTEGGIQSRKQRSFSFLLELVDDGALVRIDGQARLDDRGPRNSIAGVGRVRSPDGTFNFGFVGRPTSPAQCADLVAEFEAANGGG